MLKLKVILLTIAYIAFLNTYSQNSFHSAIGDLDDEESFDIQQTLDSGYISVGIELTLTRNISIIKLDKNANIQWTKSYAFTGNNYGTVIKQLPNNQYLIGANCRYALNLKVVVIFKIDSIGNLIWSKMYSNNYNTTIHSLTSTNNSNVLFAGTTLGFNSTGISSYIVKTDSLGNPIWQKIYYQNDNFQINSITTTIYNNLLITGFVIDSSQTKVNSFLAKLDNNGNQIWSKTYYFTKDNFINKTQINNNNILLSGAVAISNNQSDGFQPYLIKTDTSGNLLWVKKYEVINTDDITNFALQSPNSEISIITNSIDSTAQLTQPILIKLDSTGQIIWSKKYMKNDFIRSSYQTIDNGYVLSGKTLDSTTSSYKPLIFKITELGVSSCYDYPINTSQQSINLITSTIAIADSSINFNISNITANINNFSPNTTFCNLTAINEPLPNQQIQIYPNPSTSQFTITTNQQIQNIKIYNPLAELIIQTKQLTIDLTNQPSGIYFIQLQTNKEILTQKIIKQ